MPHRFEAAAHEALGQRQPAIDAWRTVLKLEPPAPSEAHFHLAGLLHAAGTDAEAKRHVLQALEDAPRFGAALELLLKLSARDDSAPGEKPAR